MNDTPSSTRGHEWTATFGDETRRWLLQTFLHLDYTGLIPSGACYFSSCLGLSFWRPGSCAVRMMYVDVTVSVRVWSSLSVCFSALFQKGTVAVLMLVCVIYFAGFHFALDCFVYPVSWTINTPKSISCTFGYMFLLYLSICNKQLFSFRLVL
jgi:hypothetical protein